VQVKQSTVGSGGPVVIYDAVAIFITPHHKQMTITGIARLAINTIKHIHTKAKPLQPNLLVVPRIRLNVLISRIFAE